ncbi:hypothetical protein FB45DRAFT_1035178 [Roridomyces roridus]|uniref:DUF6533 domain-containing protein n=1 Tax=Roridomyces roridus TaxID=1738132 RepID=A0AAD7BBE4_9AGAR|nr:hypothetical protein FB45DRAFT_1035178 [Roridomyces roridus]
MNLSAPQQYDLGGLEYETFAWDHWIYRAIFLSGFVVLFYDFFLTLGDEVRIMWDSKTKMHASTWWYLAVRYLPLGCSASILVFYFGRLSAEADLVHSKPRQHLPSNTSPSCAKMEDVLEVLLILQETLVETTLCLRVYAMCGFNPWVQASLLLTGGAASGLGIWTEIKYGKPRMLTAPGISGCHTAIPRATLMIDMIVFGLTVRRAYVERTVINMVAGSLIERMARDGAMYFGIIVLANLANVLTLFFGDVSTTRDTISTIELSTKTDDDSRNPIMVDHLVQPPSLLPLLFDPDHTRSLSVTLISRLMLNLRRAGVGNSQPTTNAETDDTELEDIHFVGQDESPAARGRRDVDSDLDLMRSGEEEV